jgi:hypothetical protein
MQDQSCKLIIHPVMKHFIVYLLDYEKVDLINFDHTNKLKSHYINFDFGVMTTVTELHHVDAAVITVHVQKFMGPCI